MTVAHIQVRLGSIGNRQSCSPKLNIVQHLSKVKCHQRLSRSTKSIRRLAWLCILPSGGRPIRKNQHCGRHGCHKCDIALGYTMIHPYSPTRHSNKLKQPCQGIVNIFQVFFPIMLGVPHRETTGCSKCFVQIIGFQSRIGLKKQSVVVFLLKTWTS